MDGLLQIAHGCMSFKATFLETYSFIIVPGQYYGHFRRLLPGFVSITSLIFVIPIKMYGKLEKGNFSRTGKWVIIVLAAPSQLTCVNALKNQEPFLLDYVFVHFELILGAAFK